ncbi:hypothetical protein ACFXKI_44430 [Streptomyces mirabilis]
MLALQIEGQVVTVDASKSNYHNLDDHIRDRLSRIRIEADKLLVDKAGPGARAHTGNGSNESDDILCRRPWEGVLASAVDRLATPGLAQYLFRPNCHSRGTNTVTNFLARSQPSPNAPRLVMGRLRSNWLVELFEERLPITVIVAAAGVDTLHGLSRILPFLPAVTAEEAARLLRGGP